MKHILVPVDGSDGARHAARLASKLAVALGAQISLVHVYDAPTASLLGLAHLSRDEVKAAEARIARGSFDAARAEIAPTVDVTEVPEIGDPAATIVQTAKARAADLVVMGSRGLSGAKGLLVGSVSDYVVHHAPCPVTIVR